MALKILEISNLVKKFGGLHAVDDVSLSISRGSITGLIGPNGSGKSTLFNTVTGIFAPDEGRVVFKGERIDRLPPNEIYLRGIARGFQVPRLFFGMTVIENLMIAPKRQIGEKLWFAPFHKKWWSQEVSLAKLARKEIDLAELQEVRQHLTDEISGGQMKLTDISRSLMGESELLMLDEPIAGISPRLADKIYALISHIRDERGTTFFIIEHRMENLCATCDRMVVMNQGKIVTDGTPKEVMNNPQVKKIYVGE